MAKLMSNLEALVANKAARDGRMYKNKEIAEAIGVSESTISRLMNSKNIESTTLRVILHLCVWLECEIADLITISR